MPENNKILKAYIPMTEPGFLLLISLLEENHGYGIMQKISEITDGRVDLGAGTVYTILYKMERDGIIAFSREVDRRKLYRITELGKELLLKETSRIKQLAQIAGDVQRQISQ